MYKAQASTSNTGFEVWWSLILYAKMIHPVSAGHQGHCIFKGIKYTLLEDQEGYPWLYSEFKVRLDSWRLFKTDTQTQSLSCFKRGALAECRAPTLASLFMHLSLMGRLREIACLVNIYRQITGRK